MTENVLIAIIGLPAAVITAVASWRASSNSRHVRKQVDTGNGVTLGRAVAHLQQEVAGLRVAFYDHAGDPEAHR